MVAQAEGERRGGVNGFAWRDQSMAANIRWIAERLPRNERIFVWAHNGHVNLDPTGTSMGSHLARCAPIPPAPAGLLGPRSFGLT